MNKLGIDIRQNDEGTTILSMTGSASLSEEAQMSRPLNGLAAARPSRLIIDLTGLDFLASLAIGQIVSLVRTVQNHGGAAAIVWGNPLIQQAMLRCGLDRMVLLCADLDEAERALAAKNV